MCPYRPPRGGGRCARLRAAHPLDQLFVELDPEAWHVGNSEISILGREPRAQDGRALIALTDVVFLGVPAAGSTCPEVEVSSQADADGGGVCCDVLSEGV